VTEPRFEIGQPVTITTDAFEPLGFPAGYVGFVVVRRKLLRLSGVWSYTVQCGERAIVVNETEIGEDL
jgi:hypothetical protein